MTKAICYVRVSSEEQAEEGYSIQAQKRLIIDYCKKNSIELIKIYEELGRSADEKGRRPVFDTMMSEILVNKPNMLIVWNTDRLYRFLKQKLEIFEMLSKNNIKLVSLTEYIDPDSPEGELAANIKASASQYEIQKIKQRTEMVHKQRLEEGIFLNRPPIGYIVNKDGKLVINKKQYKKIRLLFNDAASGMSTKDLVIKYNIKLTTIYHILKNKTYIGYRCYKGVWLKVQHPSIITDELFNQAGSRIKKKVRL